MRCLTILCHATQVDLEGPLPYSDDTFQGVICVGVTPYVVNLRDLFREWIRISRDQSIVVFSYREDRRLQPEDDGMVAMRDYEQAGLWQELHMSDMFVPMQNDRDVSNRAFVYQVRKQGQQSRL